MEESPPSSRDSDEVWVSRVRTEMAAGHTDQAWIAFEVLYNRYASQVRDTIYFFFIRRYMLTDADLAGQLMQESFLKAWENIPRKRSQAPFDRWIKRIGINEARQYMRKQGRVIPLPDEPDPLTASSDPSPDDLERFLLQRDLRDRIERVKSRLPPKQELVFRMHYDQSYSPQEIAQRLNRKPATIWQTLSRANERFREEWLKEPDSGDFALQPLKAQKGDTPETPQES